MKKQKFLILIYGFPAVGKLTIAKELSRRISFFLLHNHMIIDMICNLLPKGIERTKAKELLHLALIDKISTKNSLILTHAYSYTFKSKTGTTDNKYVEKIRKIAKKNKSTFIPVYVYCNKKEIIKRVENKDRKKFGKITNSRDIKNLLKNEDHKTPAHFKDNIQIDATHIKPKEVATILVNKIKGIQTS